MSFVLSEILNEIYKNVILLTSHRKIIFPASCYDAFIDSKGGNPTMKHKPYMILPLLILSLGLTPTSVLASTLKKCSLYVLDSGSSATASKYSAASRYSVTSSVSDDDILNIKVTASSGDSWSSDFKKSDITIYGGAYSWSDITDLTTGSHTLTIRIDVKDKDKNGRTRKTSGSSSDHDSDKNSDQGSDTKSLSSGKHSYNDTSTVSDAVLSKSTGKASWEGNAVKYDLRLYKGSSLVTSQISKKESYDFSKYIDAAGTYRFRVRAASPEKGDWIYSDDITLTAAQAAKLRANTEGRVTSSNDANESTSISTSVSPTGSSQGAWLKDSQGWWYCNADRSYTVNNWQYIGEKWYFFDEHGYMKTGWIFWNQQYYYLNADGAMLAGAWTPDHYYVDQSGIWVPAMAGYPGN